uniref:Major facilitator superfamily (MFS) profile domain-containing protein n=1 Tax=Chenopodium quinoa TaxID=63459 RepID=A0A803N6E2_CHEQI
MEDEREVPLLKKVYYEDCPGCKIEKRKDTDDSIPWKLLASIWIIVLCNALPISSLFPFLYFMIRDFHIAEQEEDVGYYAGSAFMFGRALTSVIWGKLADRYGRKPIIIIGTIAVVIFNTMFGLSVNFWMAVSTRFLLGSLCGLLGPAKAYVSEVCREEHQAVGMSMITTAWGIGLIIGPALGGLLSQIWERLSVNLPLPLSSLVHSLHGVLLKPAEKYPQMFSPESLFGRFPYFLPCLITSAFAAVITVGSFWLPESLHMHKSKNLSGDDSYEALEAASNCADEKSSGKEIEGQADVSTKSLFRNWPLMSSIIVYCIFSLHDMAYTEALSIPLLQSYPFLALLSGLSLSIFLNSASIIKNCLSVCIITSTFILQNRAVEQDQRGAANGLSMTAMSIFKAIGPACGGALLSWSEKRQDASFLPGTHMVFFLLNVVELVGVVLTFKPLLVERKD